eukprot:3716170-Alexandrium_andersonii.AAC.1
MNDVLALAAACRPSLHTPVSRFAGVEYTDDALLVARLHCRRAMFRPPREGGQRARPCGQPF